MSRATPLSARASLLLVLTVVGYSIAPSEVAAVTYLEAPALASYSVQPSGFTVEMWALYQGGPGPDPRLIRCRNSVEGACGTSSAALWQVFVCKSCGSGVVVFGFESGGACQELQTPPRIQDGRFHHIACTYDNATMRIYIDGVLAASKSLAGFQVSVGGGIVTVGNATAHNNGFDGVIDDVRIWSVSRTQAEIQASLAEEIPVSADLAAYWRLNGSGADEVAGNSLVSVGGVSYTTGALNSAANILNSATAPVPLRTFQVVLDPIACWSDASAAATAAGGYLATLTTVGEQLYVQNLARQAAASVEGALWLGLIETASEGVYTWMTGEPLSYTHWAPNEPNNNGGDETRGAMLRSAASDQDGYWNDEPECGYPPGQAIGRLGYVVETGPFDGPPPSPAPCTASDNAPGAITITWANVFNEDGYRVYRSGTLIQTLGRDITSTTDLPEAGSYQYCVEAFNSFNSSAQACDQGSRVISSAPPSPTPCAASDNATGLIVISWTNVVDESGYRLYRAGALLQTLGPNVNSTTDFPAVGQYQYCVEAFNAFGSSPQACDLGSRVGGSTSAPMSGFVALVAMAVGLGGAGTYAVLRRRPSRDPE